jgi:hypothetical protein
VSDIGFAARSAATHSIRSIEPLWCFSTIWTLQLILINLLECKRQAWQVQAFPRMLKGAEPSASSSVHLCQHFGSLVSHNSRQLAAL